MKSLQLTLAEHMNNTKVENIIKNLFFPSNERKRQIKTEQKNKMNFHTTTATTTK